MNDGLVDLAVYTLAFAGYVFIVLKWVRGKR